MTRPFLPLVLSALLAGAAPFAFAADAAKTEGAKSDSAKPEEKIPEAKVSVTKHQSRIGATTLAYTATAGTMLMKNEKDESIALFGFTAIPRTAPTSALARSCSPTTAVPARPRPGCTWASSDPSARNSSI
jgi:carboxypeptidase C (cathepsin A)